jgi:hypothetical protein
MVHNWHPVNLSRNDSLIEATERTGYLAARHRPSLEFISPICTSRMIALARFKQSPRLLAELAPTKTNVTMTDHLCMKHGHHTPLGITITFHHDKTLDEIAELAILHCLTVTKSQNYEAMITCK